jgi:hypothetical protein
MGKKTHIKLELNDEYANALANFAHDNGDLSYPSALRLLISMARRGDFRGKKGVTTSGDGFIQ